MTTSGKDWRVLVAESELSSIDGDEGRLIYRGYAIEDLARGANYEEVLYLLWHGHLPDEDELEAFTASLDDEQAVSEDVLATMERLADAEERPMAALRTAVSMFSATEPETDADPADLEATLRNGSTDHREDSDRAGRVRALPDRRGAGRSTP